MLGLADCNNFFVSCERSVNPSLEGKPVVVLSNNDGCVVARSNESKCLGIRMGCPAFEIRELVDSGSVIALSGNHLLYREISLRVHDIFRRFAPATLDYSVDEAFLDMSGVPEGELLAIGEAIYDACWDEEHIPVTIGFAPTKTMAKIATEVSKKSNVRVRLLPDAESAMPYYEKLPAGELWGIGRRLGKKMSQCGVYTIADLYHRNQSWVRSEFGVNLERSWLELHGVSCIELTHVERLLQDSISESRTFPDDVDDYDYIRARIVIYASDCARKLRAMGGECLEVGVFLRSNPFHPERCMLRPEGKVLLPHPSSDTTLITGAALTVLDDIYEEGALFKRAGVWLNRISEAKIPAPSLFGEETSDSAQMKRFMQTIDRINADVGKQNIGLASRIVKGQQGHNDGYSSSFQAPNKNK